MDNVSNEHYQEQAMTCSFADLLRPKTTLESSLDHSKRIVKRWSEKEKAELTTMFSQGTSIEQIAERLERPVSGVEGQIRKLGLKRCKALTIEQEQFLKANYWLLGTQGCAEKLSRNANAIAYYAKLLKLKKPSRDEVDPPIPRKLLPYDMVKRVSILQRKSPTSLNKVDDAVVIFYDKNAPSTAMMAMHLDELCLALDRHFGRRDGVTAGALTHGWKRK